MNKQVMIIVGVLVVATIGVGGFYVMGLNQASSTPKDAETMTTIDEQVDDSMVKESSTSGDKMTASDGAMIEEVVEIEVSSEGLAFTPKEIRVKAGSKVRLTYNNTKGTHDFVIDEFVGAKTKQISAGQSDTVEFVADKTGEYEFYCSIPGHRAAGMKGVFIVE